MFDDGCWEWLGGKTWGYGTWTVGMQRLGVHRITYALLVGPIPDGLDIHHSCHNRGCVNPSHLELLTKSQHMVAHKSGRRKV